MNLLTKRTLRQGRDEDEILPTLEQLGKVGNKAFRQHTLKQVKKLLKNKAERNKYLNECEKLEKRKSNDNPNFKPIKLNLESSRERFNSVSKSPT